MPLQVPGGPDVPDPTPPSTTGQTSWPNPAASRAVTDHQYSQLAAPWTGSGALLGLPTQLPLVYANGAALAVFVRNSRLAQVYGFTWLSGASDLVLPVTPNLTGATRYDRVVLGLDRATWDVEIYVKTGGSTMPGIVRDTGATGVFEVPIASVTVPPNATKLEVAAVQPLHFFKAEPTYVGPAGASVQHAPGQIWAVSDTPHLRWSTGSKWLTVHDDNNASRGIVYAYQGGQAANLDPHEGTWMQARTIPVMAGRSLELKARVGCSTSTGFGQVEVFVQVNGQSVTVGDTGPANIPAGRFVSAYAEEFNYVTSPTTTSIQVKGIARLSGTGGQKISLSPFYFTIVDVGPAVNYSG